MGELAYAIAILAVLFACVACPPLAMLLLLFWLLRAWVK